MTKHFMVKIVRNGPITNSEDKQHLNIEVMKGINNSVFAIK